MAQNQRENKLILWQDSIHRNGFRQFLNVRLKLAHVKSGREEVVELK